MTTLTNTSEDSARQMETSYPLHKITVALLESIHPDAQAILETAGYTVLRVDGALSEDELIEKCADAHIVGVRSKTQITRKFLESCSHLWAVGCFCIGTNQVDLAAAAERGVTVFNAPFSNTRSVAELTIAEIVGLHRKLADRSRQMHEGTWRKSASGSHEIRGRTLGIVGYGRIGSQVSVLAEAMGMRVMFHDIIDTLPLGNAVRAGSLNHLLQESDVVTLHVPADDATEKMMGERELAKMKDGAFLINNARGSVVDVDALASALKDGKLGGACVDVFPKEPASSQEPFDSPLRGLENVILTPHIGGSTLEAQENIAHEVGTKLVKYINNGSTTTSVNVPEVELPKLHDDHHRILHYHKNVPGVLSKMHQIMSDHGANVAAEFLQSNPNYSYVILDIASGESEEIKRRLADMPETIRVRTLW